MEESSHSVIVCSAYRRQMRKSFDSLSLAQDDKMGQFPSLILLFNS